MKELHSTIIAQAQASDKSACKALYEHYAPFLWRVIYRTANGNKELCEDMLQETFIRIFCNLHKFNNKSAFSTWLFRISYNTSIGIALKEKRHAQKRSPTITPETIIAQEISSVDKIILSDTLKMLSPNDRFLLMAHEISGISFEELSEITHRSAGALRVALCRIKEKLSREGSYEPTTSRPSFGTVDTRCSIAPV